MIKRWRAKVDALRKRRWVRLASNRYIVITVAFGVWMTFLDIHSCQVHREIDREIADIEQSIEYYRTEINNDQTALMQLESQTDMLEKFAREQYLLRKANEEIYLIERK